MMSEQSLLDRTMEGQTITDRGSLFLDPSDSKIPFLGGPPTP